MILKKNYLNIGDHKWVLKKERNRSTDAYWVCEACGVIAMRSGGHGQCSGEKVK